MGLDVITWEPVQKEEGFRPQLKSQERRQNQQVNDQENQDSDVLEIRQGKPFRERK